jgi:hypothetical protein
VLITLTSPPFPDPSARHPNPHPLDHVLLPHFVLRRRSLLIRLLQHPNLTPDSIVLGADTSKDTDLVDLLGARGLGLSVALVASARARTHRSDDRFSSGFGLDIYNDADLVANLS